MKYDSFSLSCCRSLSYSKEINECDNIMKSDCFSFGCCRSLSRKKVETSKLLQKSKDRKLLLFFNAKSTRTVSLGRDQKISSQILFTSSFVTSTTLVCPLPSSVLKMVLSPRIGARLVLSAAGEFSSPWSTFGADSYFGIRSTPVLPQ